MINGVNFVYVCNLFWSQRILIAIGSFAIELDCNWTCFDLINKNDCSLFNSVAYLGDEHV